jgi:hypothetical protein
MCLTHVQIPESTIESDKYPLAITYSGSYLSPPRTAIRFHVAGVSFHFISLIASRVSRIRKRYREKLVLVSVFVLFHQLCSLI